MIDAARDFDSDGDADDLPGAAGARLGSSQGTALFGELRSRGFGGLLIIQSANDELEDERAYIAAGADGSVGKAVKGGVQTMLGVLARLWHEKFAGGGYKLLASDIRT